MNDENTFVIQFTIPRTYLSPLTIICNQDICASNIVGLQLIIINILIEFQAKMNHFYNQTNM